MFGKQNTWRERAEIEQQELKERLAKLTDFLNSKEYFELDARQRNLLGTQRAGMEIYLNALTQRLYGDEQPNMGSMWPMLVLSMFGTGGGLPTIKDKNDETNDNIKRGA